MKKRKRFHRLALGFDQIMEALAQSFDQIKDHRASNSKYALGDVLRSAFAVFSLKYPSLLHLEERNANELANLKNVYRIKAIPSDTQMRTILDPILPQTLNLSFRRMVQFLEQFGVWTRYKYKRKFQLISLDGVQHFRSQKIRCQHCKITKEKNGQRSFSHTISAAVLVHPNYPEVFPIDLEPTTHQTAKTKQDCEQNAAKRILKRLALNYPKQDLMFLGDALYATGPFIRQILDNKWNYLLSVKPNSHALLFKQVQAKQHTKAMGFEEFKDQNGYQHYFRFYNKLVLNDRNADLEVNMLCYEQIDPKGKRNQFTWISNKPFSKANVESMMRAARCRWKIENETFNTLKNQGYNFGHNFGHGQFHLSANLASLMFLAFFADQLQQHCSPLFRDVLHLGFQTRKRFWEEYRAVFRIIPVQSMKEWLLKIAAIREIPIKNST